MKLKILLPRRVLLDETVVRVTAEAPDGALTLKPRHVDFVSSLAPGIVSYQQETAASPRFAAVDTGILVKRGDTVLISTRQGVRGDDLHTLHQTVRDEFARLDQQERQMQVALARLESAFVQRFIELDPSS